MQLAKGSIGANDEVATFGTRPPPAVQFRLLMHDGIEGQRTKPRPTGGEAFTPRLKAPIPGAPATAGLAFAAANHEFDSRIAMAARVAPIGSGVEVAPYGLCAGSRNIPRDLAAIRPLDGRPRGDRLAHKRTHRPKGRLRLERPERRSCRVGFRLPEHPLAFNAHGPIKEIGDHSGATLVRDSRELSLVQ